MKKGQYSSTFILMSIMAMIDEIRSNKIDFSRVDTSAAYCESGNAAWTGIFETTIDGKDAIYEHMKKFMCNGVTIRHEVVGVKNNGWFKPAYNIYRVRVEYRTNGNHIEKSPRMVDK